jgi:hypothetical protein
MGDDGVWRQPLLPQLDHRLRASHAAHHLGFEIARLLDLRDPARRLGGVADVLHTRNRAALDAQGHHLVPEPRQFGGDMDKLAREVLVDEQEGLASHQGRRSGGLERVVQQTRDVRCGYPGPRVQAQQDQQVVVVGPGQLACAVGQPALGTHHLALGA